MKLLTIDDYPVKGVKILNVKGEDYILYSSCDMALVILSLTSGPSNSFTLYLYLFHPWLRTVAVAINDASVLFEIIVDATIDPIVPTPHSIAGQYDLTIIVPFWRSAFFLSSSVTSSSFLDAFGASFATNTLVAITPTDPVTARTIGIAFLIPLFMFFSPFSYTHAYYFIQCMNINRIQFLFL
mgnify:CR=1 FL=1